MVVLNKLTLSKIFACFTLFFSVLHLLSIIIQNEPTWAIVARVSSVIYTLKFGRYEAHVRATSAQSALFALKLIAAVFAFVAISKQTPVMMMPIVVVTAILLLVNSATLILAIVALADPDSFYAVYIRQNQSSNGNEDSSCSVASFATKSLLSSVFFILISLKGMYVHVGSYRILREEITKIFQAIHFLTMFSLSTTVSLIIYAIYVPILFGIYLIQVIIVIANKRKPQFRSSYYTLFIIEAFTGLITCLLTTAFLKAAILPEINGVFANFPSNAFTTMISFSGYYFPACQEYVNIFIALNRLSALLLSANYERMWRLLGWLCLPVIFGFPFISYYHLVDTAAYFATRDNGTSWILDYDHSVRPWRSNRVSTFYLYLVCSITTVAINLATVVAIRCVSMEKVSSFEYRLFLLGFSSFASGLPMTAQQCAYMFIADEDVLTAMSYTLPWLYDLKALSPGIMSLIFSSAIRNELVKTLKRRQTTVVASI